MYRADFAEVHPHMVFVRVATLSTAGHDSGRFDFLWDLDLGERGGRWSRQPGGVQRHRVRIEN